MRRGRGWCRWKNPSTYLLSFQQVPSPRHNTYTLNRHDQGAPTYNAQPSTTIPSFLRLTLAIAVLFARPDGNPHFLGPAGQALLSFSVIAHRNPPPSDRTHFLKPTSASSILFKLEISILVSAGTEPLALISVQNSKCWTLQAF